MLAASFKSLKISHMYNVSKSNLTYSIKFDIRNLKLENLIKHVFKRQESHACRAVTI